MRISDIKKFFEKITPSLKKRIYSLNVKDFAYTNELMIIEMVNGNLNIAVKDNASQKHLTMVAFGIVPFIDVVLHTIFGQLNTKFSILDEF